MNPLTPFARLFVLAVVACTAVACASETDEGDPDEVLASDAAEALTGSIPVGTLLRTMGTVKLRTDPSTSSASIKTLAASTTVTVVLAESQDGFYRVKHKSSEGWVSGTYLARSDDSSAGGYPSSKNISLVYQGSCSFLHRCDSYSKKLPVGQVMWGCPARAEVCIDSEHWASGPSREYCGKTVRFCKGSVCTTAVIKDVSVSHDFEGSQGVFDALGIGYGGGTTCTNTYIDGDPRVTVSY